LLKAIALKAVLAAPDYKYRNKEMEVVIEMIATGCAKEYSIYYTKGRKVYLLSMSKIYGAA
jgi:hypothetical protein